MALTSVKFAVNRIVMSTLIKIFFAFLVIAFSGSSNAALITTSGNSVKFTYDDSLLGLFGAPVVSGDSLTFSPSSFKAISLGLSSGSFSDSTFVVTISSVFEHALDSVTLSETGKYSLRGVGAEALVSGTLSAIDLNAPNPVDSAISSDIFFDKLRKHSPISVGNWGDENTQFAQL